MSSEKEMNRKRKINGQDFPMPRIFPTTDHHHHHQLDRDEEEEDNDLLTLSLSSYPHQSSTTLPCSKVSTVHNHPPSSSPPLPPPPPQQPILSQTVPFSMHLSPSTPHSLFINPPPIIIPPEIVTPTSHSTGGAGPSRPRARRNPSQSPREGKSDTVPAQYPWATNRRATVHSLSYLLSNEIFTVSGDVQCKRCERHYTMEFDLRQKFMEIGSFIAENKAQMHDRAPRIWMNPTLPTCRFCEQENSVKPVIADKKKSINWLFLLLGQMLGCCALDQLKYFCKHTKNHRTGAKDRVLYLTYLGLCKQLDPNGPFDR